MNTRQIRKEIIDICKHLGVAEEILFRLIDRLRLEIYEDGSLRLITIRKQKCTPKRKE